MLDPGSGTTRPCWNRCSLVGGSVPLCRQALRVAGTQTLHNEEEGFLLLLLNQDREISTVAVPCLPGSYPAFFIRLALGMVSSQLCNPAKAYIR